MSKAIYSIYIGTAVIVICSALTISSCSKSDSTTNNTAPTLYTRLGGEASIAAVVDKFLTNVAADTIINKRFAATVADQFRLQLLRNNLIDQICAGSGGPCVYKGKTMLAAHAGMNISDAEFTALVGDLTSALNSFSVAAKEQSDLLAVLGPMKTDIVGH